MSVPQKYMFDNAFDVVEAPVDPMEELRVAFEEKLKAARAESFKEGHKAGMNEALGTIENETKTALQQLVAKETELMESFKSQQSLSEAKAVEVGITAGCKLARELIRQNPEALLEGFFRQALDLIRGEAQITARLHPDVITNLKSRLPEWSEEVGFKGQITLLEDASLEVSDANINWQDGGLKRSVNDLMNAINTAMTSFFSADEAQQRTTDKNATPKPTRAGVENE